MSERPQVVLADPMHESGIDMLQESFDVHVLARNAEPFPAALRNADAIVVRTYKLPGSVIAQCPRLRAIVKHGAGVDNIDIDAATARGIPVANTGDANAQSVAELAVTLMLAASRRTVAMHQAVVGGHYDIRWNLLLQGIHGKTLGIIGFGNIGRLVAATCRCGFQMDVIVYDPYLNSTQVAAHQATQVGDLDSLLRRADVVSIHTGLSGASQHLIGERELGLMKSTAILVNTARGGVVDEAALARALSAGQIYGAGLDVFEEEPPGRDHALFGLDNVALSPHVGGATVASRIAMSTRAAEAVKAILDGRSPRFLLNPAANRLTELTTTTAP